jgi:hypothetical protein
MQAPVDALIGFVVNQDTPLQPEALYEVTLYPGGMAAWRLVEEKSGLARSNPGIYLNGATFDRIYEDGHAARACFPELAQPDEGGPVVLGEEG